MPDTIYMVSSSRYWSGVYPETFATDVADIEKLVRERCERLCYEVKFIEVDMAAQTVMMFETCGCCTTYHILVVKRI